jgi:hypothetical protein
MSTQHAHLSRNPTLCNRRRYLLFIIQMPIWLQGGLMSALSMPAGMSKESCMGRPDKTRSAPLETPERGWHCAGVHAAEQHDQVAAGLAGVRLPGAAGPVLLLRGLRRSHRARPGRGAPQGLLLCRRQDLRRQRGGHARAVGVPGARLFWLPGTHPPEKGRKEKEKNSGIVPCMQQPPVPSPPAQ